MTSSSLLAGVYVLPFEEIYDRIPITSLTELERQEIALEYQRWSFTFGLDVRVLFAQALLETNGFKFGNLVSATQHNPCGLGATGPENPGATFKTWELGVIAHCAHLALYTFPNHVCAECSRNYDPRHTTHSIFQEEHGRSLVLSDLDGKWAVPGIGYGQHIADVWNRGV